MEENYRWEIRMKQRFPTKRRMKVLLISLLTVVYWITSIVISFYIWFLIHPQSAFWYSLLCYCFLSFLLVVRRSLEFFNVRTIYFQRIIKAIFPMPLPLAITSLAIIFGTEGSLLAADFKNANDAGFQEWALFLSNAILDGVTFGFASEFDFRLTNIEASGMFSKLLLSLLRLNIYFTLIGIGIYIYRLFYPKTELCTLSEMVNIAFTYQMPGEYSIKKIGVIHSLPNEYAMGLDQFLNKNEKCE